MISYFSVIPIRWLLTVDSEMASFLFRSLAEDLLVFFSNSCDSRKINCLTVVNSTVDFAGKTDVTLIPS